MQNKPNLPAPQMNVNAVITKYYENEQLCRRRENKPKQTQFLKILDNLSIIISAPFLTGLDYSLFFENFAGQVIGEGNLDCQRLLDVFDFVGHVEGESVINGY